MNRESIEKNSDKSGIIGINREESGIIGMFQDEKSGFFGINGHS